MTDLLAEVDAAMRQERLEKLWKDHGKTVLAGLGAIILATAVGSGIKHWNHARNIRQTDALLALLDDKDFPANVVSADLEMKGGLRGVALLTAAGALLDENKSAEALALYTRAADDSGVDADLRQLAALMRVRLDSELTGQDALKILKSVWSDGASPWRHHARIEAAALYAAQKDYDSARKQLETIKEAENLPPGLYGKARALDHVYALEQQEAAQKEKDTKTDGES